MEVVFAVEVEAFGVADVSVVEDVALVVSAVSAALVVLVVFSFKNMGYEVWPNDGYTFSTS